MRIMSDDGNEILWHVVNMAEALIDIKTFWVVSTLSEIGGACAHQSEIIILLKLF